MNEPILIENPNRFSLFPVHHPDIFNYYKDHISTFWTAEEVDLSGDRFDELTKNEQYFIKNILAFFANSDGIVNENLAMNFYNSVQYPEAKAFYSVQLVIETIHSEVYSLLIDTYIKDADEKNKLFQAITNYPVVKKKAEWALKWINNGSFVEKLVAFAIVEGLLFSGSFCALYWLKKRGLMKGLTFSNELIARDETLHARFAINLYNNHVQNKLSTERIEEIILSALEVEKEFIIESLPVSLIGMNSDLMIQYLEYVTDTLLVNFGCSKKFNSVQPFKFMENIGLDGKTNFFERKVGEYSKSGSHGTNKVTFDDQF